MAVTICPPGVWTPIPDTGGDMLLEARGTGFYVATGTQPATPAEGYAQAAMTSRIIPAGTSVWVQPAQPIKYVRAYSNLG